MAKKKKGRALAGGAVLLCALIGVEAALSWQNSQEETEAETEGVTPLEISADDLTEVTVKNENGTFTLVKDADGVWSNKEDAQFPLDEDTWTAKLSSLESMTAVRTLEEPEDLAEYGLDDAAIQVTLVTEDGSTELHIGNQNESTYDYYVYVDSPDTVYTVGSSAATGMDCGLYDLASASTFPSISSGSLTHMEIRQDESLLEFDADASDTESASWYVSRDGGEAVPADSSAMSALTDELLYIGFEDFVDYKGDDLAQYGLDDPWAEITWDYTETESVEEETEETAETESAEEETEETVEAESAEETTEEETEPETVEVEKQTVLLIGNPIYAETESETEAESQETESETEAESQETESETEAESQETEAETEEAEPEITGYYVKLADSSEVYTMTADDLATWLSAEYTDYVNKYISAVPQTALSSLTVAYEGEDYVLTVESEVQTVETEETAQSETAEAAETAEGAADTAETIQETETEETEPETEIVYSYLVNGREADETAFQTFYGSVTSMMAQTITEDTVSGEPDFAFYFEKTDGTEVSAEYYLGSDGMYTVLCSTGLCGKVNKLEADDMMEEFRTLISAEETAQETEEETETETETVLES